MLKKAIDAPLPCGRGSVAGCKYVETLLSRARQQAVLRVFPQPL